MSTLQVANVWFESTANNRIQYGSNSYVLVAGGANTLTVNSTAVVHGANTTTFGSAMWLVANGNLGIGTSSPTKKLEVYGDARLSSSGSTELSLSTSGANTSYHIFSALSSSGFDYATLIFSSNTYRFNISGSEAMRIDSSGNVGIGTSSPDSSLHVYKAATSAEAVLLHLQNGGSGSAIATLKIGEGSPESQYGVLGHYGVDNSFRIGAVASSSAYMSFHTGNIGSTNLSTNERMRIDSSGNVGIGTSSPSQKLEVNGGILSGSSTSTTAGIYINSSASSGCQFNWYSAGTIKWAMGRNVGTGGANDLATYNYNNSTTAMIIDSNSNLLVGYATSNGSYKLQVNSQIFATSSTIATSDARYKQNVETLNGALSIVQALRPVSFDWKQHPVHAFDTENTTVGFLAQEVQQALAGKPYLNSIIRKNECVIVPEVKDEDGVVTKSAVTEEFLGIAEGNMIAILTSAIQELSAKNDALEARLAALENK
jgi:hypothetical protein